MTETEHAAMVPVVCALDADCRAAVDLGVVRLATIQRRAVMLPTGEGVRRLPNLTAHVFIHSAFLSGTY